MTDKGQRLLAKSTAPVAVRDRDGKLSPIDMTLKRTASGDFEPRNVSAPVTLGQTADEGLRLENAEVTIAPAGARSAKGVQTADSVFYPNVYGPERDTDLIQAPHVAYGAEVSWILRSPRASTSLPLDIDMPAGAKLRRGIPIKDLPGVPKAIEIYQGEKSLAYVSAPIAYDADGRDVPATAEIVGDQIVVNVEHDKSNYRWPIYVDPIASDGTQAWVDRQGTNTSNSASPGEWYFSQGGTTQYTWAAGDPVYNYGMLASMPTNRTFPNGSYGIWRFTAPANTKTNRATFLADDFKAYDFYGYKLSQTFKGLTNPGFTAWLTGDYGYQYLSTYTKAHPYIGNGGNYTGLTQTFFCVGPASCEDPAVGNGAQFALQTNNTVNGQSVSTGSQSSYDRVFAATVYLTDNENPTIQNPIRVGPSTGISPGIGSAPTNAWRDPGASPQPSSVSAELDDPGVGPYAITATGSGASNLNVTLNGSTCAGTLSGQARCKKYTVGYVPQEGSTTINLQGRDNSGRLAATTSATTWTDRVDTTQPDLGTPAGNLWDAREQPTDHRAEGHYNGMGELSITASDAGSQLKEVVVVRDGTQWGAPATYDSASGRYKWTEPTGFQVADGRYRLEIAARDNLWSSGHNLASRHERKTDSFYVTIDRRGDVHTARHVTGDPATSGETLAREWARQNTTTARRELPGDIVTTRSPAECWDQSTTRACESVRTRTRMGSAATNDTDDFVVTRGDANDPDLKQISQLLAPGTSPNYPVSTTGSLLSVTAPWQVLPPAHGTQFRRYDYTESRTPGSPSGPEDGEPGSAETFTQRVYVDATTLMPVRRTEVDANGQTVNESFWTYGSQRTLTSEHPADFFAVAEPATPNERVEIRQERDRPITTVQDQQTGTSFQPWSFGNVLDLAGIGVFCLARNDINMSSRGPSLLDEVPVGEEDPAIPPALARALKDTFVSSTYQLKLGSTCAPGPLLSNLRFSVTTFAKNSTEAAAWRSVFTEDSSHGVDQNSPTYGREGSFPITVGSIQTVAHLVPGAEGITSALMDLDETTVMITGPLDSTLLTTIASKLGRQ